MIDMESRKGKVFEYKTITVSPDGIRVKGDDISDKIEKLCLIFKGNFFTFIFSIVFVVILVSKISVSIIS